MIGARKGKLDLFEFSWQKADSRILNLQWGNVKKIQFFLNFDVLTKKSQIFSVCFLTNETELRISMIGALD